MRTTRLYIQGAWTEGAHIEPLVDAYTGEQLAEVGCADAAQVAAAVADVARASVDGLDPYERFRILARASELVEQHRAELLDLIVDDTGFTRRDAATEVDRAVQTFRLSGEEATRLVGEMVPLEGAPGITERLGYTLRVPVGVVAAITPFNSPLNTVAHKVGPALAAGNTVVLKPSLATPLTAERLVSLLLEAGLPSGHIALLQGTGEQVGQALLTDDRIGFYTFTGSSEVGRIIQRTVGLRRTSLELGSLSSTIVCSDADLQSAAAKCVNAAFRKAGQVCTSVQRLYVHADVLDEFADALLANVARQRVGDPRDEATTVGPLIDRSAAERVAAWVDRAVEDGARLLTGGDRDGAVVQPTVLTDVSQQTPVMCREVFGPVVSLRAFHELDAAIDEANATPYGLAAGIFTRDLHRALAASQRLRVGSVHVNETSSSRIDLMPYGGVKDSGFGHEGPRYAAREMTEERLVTINHAD